MDRFSNAASGDIVLALAFALIAVGGGELAALVVIAAAPPPD